MAMSPERPARKRARGSGGRSACVGGHRPITAVAAAMILALTAGRAAASRPPRDDRDNNIIHNPKATAPAPRPPPPRRRRPDAPLNATRVHLSPVLARRYDWLRQSPALSRFLDGHLAEDRPPGDRRPRDRGRPRDGRGRGGASRALDGAAYDDGIGDDAAAADDAYAADDYVAATPAPTPSPTATAVYICDDKACTVNEKCTEFLFGFLEGTTDADDNCEGIGNAYVAAECGTLRKKGSSGGSNSGSTIYDMDDDFNDDYFGDFYDHQCCSSLRGHYYEYCDAQELLNGYNLLLVAGVLLLCECAKSVVKKNGIRWLPEAAACMLVGMSVALGARLLKSDIENVGFDEEIFMYLLLPPIIFEAALSVNKREFRRRRGAIIIFALLGTLFSSFLTGTATYYSAKYLTGDESLSILDSLVFGSLISSIDPVAILSVLSSLNLSETDTIYILVFGESLLNDGIAITLFKSLVQEYGSSSAITVDDILGSIADFLINAFGSCVVGLACGIACLCYFHLNASILHPVMEVASFFLWAVVPYWMSEALDWSGIVAIVVMGFFMDIYLRPGWDPAALQLEEERRQLMLAAASGHGMPMRVPMGPGGSGLEYYNWNDDDQDGGFRFRGTAVDIPRPHLLTPPPPDREGGEASCAGGREGDADTVADGSTTNPNIKAILLKREFVRMSREADEHVCFVAHLLSSLSENAIFAYLGLFLFSSKYEWDIILCSIGVVACIASRALMVVCASSLIWYMHVFRQRAGCQNKYNNDVSPCNLDDLESKSTNREDEVDPLNTPISKSVRALSNYKVQMVLILAGLRGAVSLALVESVPIYNGVTGIGSKNKPLLKAMTSSAIIFTIFVLGGGAYYILTWLDISNDDMLIKSSKKSMNQAGFYPSLACGGCARESSPEMELAAAPSWRSHPRSPSLRERSKSDWSHASTYSVGLNDAGRQSILSPGSTQSDVDDIFDRNIT